MPHIRQTRRTLGLALAGAALSACAGSSHPGGPGSPGDLTPAHAAPAPYSGVIPPTANALPVGVTIAGRINAPISDATPVGDAISATVTADVHAANGSVAIPTGTVVRGVVTGIHDGDAKSPSVVRVNFDYLELKGRSYYIRSTVTAVTAAAPPVAATAATSKPVNAKLGEILASTAVAGLLPTQPAVATRGTSLLLAPAGAASGELPIGSILTIRLDSAVAVLR